MLIYRILADESAPSMMQTMGSRREISPSTRDRSLDEKSSGIKLKELKLRVDILKIVLPSKIVVIKSSPISFYRKCPAQEPPFPKEIRNV